MSAFSCGCNLNAGCCGCCSALRPRYKRLVDNIFPVDPEDGLVRNNMDKLTFYALSSPEKLDRIGDYLAQRLNRDIARHKLGYVVIAMEALDQLLVACHAQTLNLFVESFLKMVQKLLECHEPDLQVLATQSFIKFANIEEDTPSYHRRYDFFVSKFSSMCHNNSSDPETCIRVRVAGLKGIQGVVRKTVSDDLQVNIWDQSHMDKIVPSLLFNMHEANSNELNETPESPHEDEHPASLAESCLRDLMCRAAFGNIKYVLRPVLKHLDLHELWVPNDFAIKCFKIIMYSVQAQYSYVVVQMLISHLDEHSKDEATIRASIVNVLLQTVLIAAGGSIGPSVLEVFNTMLRHLRLSVSLKTTDEKELNDEKLFQEALVNTLGEFANNLPDYQKIEIMMFVMNKIPLPSDEVPSEYGDVLLQNMLLQSVLKVATKYSTVHMTTAFPYAFLDPLLRMSVAPDPGIRILVQHILHALIDRHSNLPKLQIPSIPDDISDLDLTIEKCNHQDVMFIKKNGAEIFWHLYDNLQQSNNKLENFEAVYSTLALLCVELGNEEIMCELLRLTFGLQDMANNNTCITSEHRCIVHAIVACYLNLICQLTAIPTLVQHVKEIINKRSETAPYLLPDFCFGEKASPESFSKELNFSENLLFDKNVINETLRSTGHDTTRLMNPFVPNRSDISQAKSISDIHSISLDVDSVHSSPGVARKHPEEEVTFESLKKIMTESSEKNKEAEKEKRMQILETFRTAPFEDLVARSESKALQFQNKLNEIFSRLPFGVKEYDLRESSSLDKCQPNTTLYEVQFPDLFVF